MTPAAKGAFCKEDINLLPESIKSTGFSFLWGEGREEFKVASFQSDVDVLFKIKSLSFDMEPCL